MTERTRLAGRYKILDEAFLREKANRSHEETRIFYIAMLANRTYEAYLAVVGHRQTMVEGYKQNPKTGRGEILYAR